jgi:nitrate reductase NapE component
MIPVMKDLTHLTDEVNLQRKADRAQWIIFIVMLVLMILPLVAVWLTGALHF